VNGNGCLGQYLSGGAKQFVKGRARGSKFDIELFTDRKVTLVESFTCGVICGADDWKII
jgi:hypothetical protein